jgi:hypothetical protein
MLLYTYRGLFTIILWGISLVNYVKLLSINGEGIPNNNYLIMIIALSITFAFLIKNKFTSIRNCKPNISLLIFIFICDYLYIKLFIDKDYYNNNIIIFFSIFTLLLLNISVFFQIEE